jgi:hypothetical protein
MVDKRSLRSSKKDSQDTPADDEKPKPTRTRSGRTRKGTGKSKEDTPATEDLSAAQSVQSEDVVMETESVTAPEKTNEEDVEMKNADEESKDETKEELPKEDPTASPITGIRVEMPMLMSSYQAEPSIIGKSCEYIGSSICLSCVENVKSSKTT